jgi:phosphatidylinositol glycan class B
MLKELYEKQTSDWKETFKKVFFLSLFFHLVAAFFSEGFHRPDEHLGIMRFVAWKLGMVTDSQAHVSWEWDARIRPWLQPAMYYIFLAPFKAIGLENPFHLATLYRFLNALLGQASLAILMLQSPFFISQEKVKKITLWTLALLWYVPFFHARGTSEHFSTTFFIFALPFFLGNKRIVNALICGAFFGMSFIFRYQMCVPVFFICLWQLFQKEKHITFLALITFSFFTINGLSSLIDYWGYGEWVFPPYQYLYWNIFEGKASSFGVDPWWKYFEKVVTRGIPPISLPLFIATLWFWAKRPWHILTAITLPFFIVHSMIGHKEIRFLFGIGLFSPLLFGLFLEKFQNLLEWKKTAKFIAGLAIILMIISSVKVAYTPITFYRDLYNSGFTSKVIYTSDVVRDPMWFYMRDPFDFKLLQKPEFIEKMSSESGLYFSNDYELQDKLTKECEIIHQTYPQWVLDIKPNFIKMKYWGLYNCKGTFK